jgi:integrase
VIDIERRHIYPEFKRGKKVYYFRIGHGRRIRIREEPGTEEFDRRYHELLRQAQAGELRQELRGTSEHGVAKAGTWRWLAQAYMASAEFRALDPGGTQRPRWLILERTFKEPRAPGAKELFADCPLDLFTRKAVKILHNRIADTPDAANARLQAIRAVFRWALDNEVGGLTVNPARDVKRLPPKRQGGWPTWSQEEVEKFHARHPRGTKARVAFDLLRFTGVRRSDVILLGRQHIKDGALSILAFKGRNRFPVQVDLPIVPELRATLDAGPVGDLLFLVSHYGKPFMANGFSRWFKKQCVAAGIEDRSPHGVRKVAAVVAAENGATPHQLGSMLGWKTLAQPERYTKAASRKRLALGAARLLASQIANKNPSQVASEHPM